MPGPGRFSEKEDEQIQAIKEALMRGGLSEKEAEHRAYGRVVNQQKHKKSKRYHVQK
jgi:hypothetical protein